MAESKPNKNGDVFVWDGLGNTLGELPDIEHTTDEWARMVNYYTEYMANKRIFYNAEGKTNYLPRKYFYPSFDSDYCFQGRLYKMKNEWGDVTGQFFILEQPVKRCFWNVHADPSYAMAIVAREIAENVWAGRETLIGEGNFSVNTGGDFTGHLEWVRFSSFVDEDPQFVKKDK